MKRTTKTLVGRSDSAQRSSAAASRMPMKTAKLSFASALSLARLVRTRKIGCLELLEHYLARVEKYDPKLNAIVVRDFDAARKRARRLDGQLKRGAALGPLAGVPMTVKESYDLAGHPTTRGLPELKGHRAKRNAAAVDRLLAAGANVFGKTNVPVHLSDWQTFNPIYGTTNNPWDVSRVPGGSSGGSAAALAAGLTALEIGSDIGASIRNPAHYCGVYGHKATWGLCARGGHTLHGAVAEPDISALGPLARSAADLAVATKLMAGRDETESEAWSITLAKPRPQRLRDWRVAVMLDHPTAPVDDSVQRAIAGVAEFLKRAKAKVSFEARPAVDPEEAHELYLLMLRAGTVGLLSEERLRELEAAKSRLAPSDKSYYAHLVRASTLPHREWLRLNERRHQLRLAWAAFFKDWDALLCPVAATAAFPHNHEGERWERMIPVNGVPQPSTTQMFWAGYSGLFYLPTTAAPAGESPEGLPIGVQIVGPQYGDLTTIELARWLEREYRAFVPPPGYE